LLLERAAIPVVEAVERLGGMQAQEPKPPFTGLWSRLGGFARDDLRQALHDRRLVRATFLRGTLHLVSADDYRAFRATLQPVLSRALGVLGERGAGLEPEQVLPVARDLLAERPRTFGELRPALAEVFPHANDRALGLATRMLLPLVMVPSDDRWGFPANADFALAEPWLNVSLAPAADPEALLLRYLASFGPARAIDMQTWSGLQGMADVLNRLRPQLCVFRDELGRELFDLPDASRPEPDTAAAPRFLPEFDNLRLSHADRGRIIAEEHRRLVYLSKNLRVQATFLLDGFVAGTWRTERKKGTAILRLAPFAAIANADAAALVAEGETLLRFLEPDAATFEVAQGVPSDPA
jgi:hypothetical protein